MVAHCVNILSDFRLDFSDFAPEKSRNLEKNHEKITESGEKSRNFEKNHGKYVILAQNRAKKAIFRPFSGKIA